MFCYQCIHAGLTACPYDCGGGERQGNAHGCVQADRDDAGVNGVRLLGHQAYVHVDGAHRACERVRDRWVHGYASVYGVRSGAAINRRP